MNSQLRYGGPAGTSHLQRVAVSREKRPPFLSRPNRHAMSNHRPSKELLNDQNIASWHTNLREGSEITADVYLRRLNRFCHEHNTTPQTLATMDTKTAFTLLVDSVSYYRLKGLAGSTIKGYVKPVRSWLAHNDIDITKTVKIRGASSTPTLKNEKTPEPHELHSVWRFCDERQAAAISIIAFTGFRPGVLGNYCGHDGLRLQDFAELRVDNEQKKVTFTAMPTRVVVREEQSKTGRAYEGFLCEEGCRQLEIYLVKRMKAEERLGPQSAVIADDLRGGRTITTKAVCKIIRKAFRHAGLQWRPYILRRYYDTRMGQAAAKPDMGLLEEWVRFWMGHHGDIEATYRLHKKLPDSLVEQMRQAYRRASETMLQTVSVNRRDDMMRRELRATALGMVGFTDDEIKHLDLEALTANEFQDLAKKKMGLNTRNRGSPSRQLVVSAEQAKKYINGQGWVFRGSMASGEVVIESTSSSPTA